MSERHYDHYSPGASALQDFILEHIHGRELNATSWEIGYPFHGIHVVPWKKAFRHPPASPPKTMISAIRLLLEDSGAVPPDFSWMTVQDKYDHTFLANIFNATYCLYEKKTGGQSTHFTEESRQEICTIITDLLDAILMNDDRTGPAPWVVLPQFKAAFAAEMALFSGTNKSTLLHEAAIVGDPALYGRVIRLYEEYAPAILPSHLGHIGEISKHSPLHEALKRPSETMLLRICALYREHLSPETLRTHLSQSDKNSFNLLHDLLARAPGEDAYRYSSKTIIEVLRLYVRAFGAEKAQKTVESQLQDTNLYGYLPTKKTEIDNVLRLLAEAKKLEAAPDAVTQAGTTNTPSRAEAYRKKWGASKIT